MDLRVEYPRSIRDTLGGYVHLGRMIDKCRACQAGTPGDYVYPCPLDERLLRFVGISSDDFSRAVRWRTDEEIVDWFRLTAIPRSQSEIDTWNDMMLRAEPDSDDKWAYFKRARDVIDPARTDITTWADLLDLDEKRPVPWRAATAGGGRR